MTKLLGLLFAVFCLTVGLGQSAHAQYLQASAIALAPPATNCTNDPGACLVIGGLTISVSGTASCQNGGNSCPDLFLAPTSGPGASVIIEAATGDIPGVSTLEPIFSYTCSGTCTGEYDLSVDLSVVGGAHSQPITGVAGTLTGSATPSGLPFSVTLGENITPGNSSSSLCNGVAGESVNLSSPTFSCSFSGQTSLNVSKDMGLKDLFMSSGNTYTLTSVTQSFTPAPEPASLATLLGGLVALGAVRRRRRQA